MKIDFDTYCKLCEVPILDNIENEIRNINLPSFVHEKLIQIIDKYNCDVLEHYYEQKYSEYEDNKYQEHKESKIF